MEAGVQRALAERWFWAPIASPLRRAYCELRSFSLGGMRVVLLRAGWQAERAGPLTALVWCGCGEPQKFIPQQTRESLRGPLALGAVTWSISGCLRYTCARVEQSEVGLHCSYRKYICNPHLTPLLLGIARLLSHQREM